MKDKPVCERGPKWLKESQHNPKILAPLTGQDHQAYRTFCHALELYAYCDGEGQWHALVVMKHAVLAMQEKTRWIAQETIPHVFDWGDRETLWAKIMRPDLEEHVRGIMAAPRPTMAESIRRLVGA